MKTILKVFTLVSLMSLVACNEQKRGNDSDAAYDNDDSKEQAEEVNEEKFEDSNMESDADFVSNAVASNYAEIELARLAADRSKDPEVKKVASMLVMEHTKTLGELKTLAQAKGITVPTDGGEDAKNQAEKFAGKEAEDFNKDWCKEMIDKHEKSINQYEKRMDKTEDAELKAWLGKTVPHLRNHLEQLSACHEKMKDTNS